MKRKLALLLAVVMILSLVPMMSFASAASVSAVSVPVVTRGTGTAPQDLGSMRITVPAGARIANQKLTIDFPSGVELPNGAANGTFTVGTSVYYNNNGSAVQVLLPNAGDNGIVQSNPGTGNLTNPATDNLVLQRAGNRKLEITFRNDVHIDDDGVMVIQLRNMDTTRASAGDIKATLSASPNSGYPTGEVTIGRVASGASVQLSTSSRDTALDAFTFHLNVLEDTPGSVNDGRTITLRLPVGYEWNASMDGHVDTDTKFGPTPGYAISKLAGADGRDLRISFNVDSTELRSFAIRNLAFFVSDETRVRDGEIEVTVSSGGGLGRNVSKLVVGTRSDFGISIKMEEVDTVLSGKLRQEIEDLIIKESIEGSLLANRAITLTLPDSARWEDPTAATVDSEEASNADITLSRSSNNRVLRITFAPTYSQADADTITIEDLEIVVEPGFEGDVVATVAGSQGLTGELVIAKAVKPVKVEVEGAAKEVIIGRSSQAIAEILISEIEPEAIEQGTIELRLPTGVTWSALPTVTVVEGDVDLGTVTRDGGLVRIPVDAESLDEAVIKVSNGLITVDRTVPEGNINVRVTGTAVVDPAVGGTGAIWPNSGNAASVTVAKVATPAPADAIKGEVSLTIGVVPEGGDAAPYVKNNRTYAPVSVVAQALGVSKSNIIWNAEARTVTILGDKTVQMTIGSTTLLVNGTPVVMDVAPEITSARTFLPIAWLAKALDVEYSWDAATQTVTFH